MDNYEKAANIVIWVVFLAIIFFGGKAIVDAINAPIHEAPAVEEPVAQEATPEEPQPEPEVQKPAYDEVEVYGNAKAGVMKQLKAPRTAKFPSASKANIIEYEPEKYFVRSYVDSENSFGAMIRSEWFVDMEYVGDMVKFNEIIIK